MTSNHLLFAITHFNDSINKTDILEAVPIKNYL